MNPVGFGSMLIASVVSVTAFFGGFGSVAAAYSPFLALGVAFVLSPALCLLTRGRFYLARPDDLQPPLWAPTARCPLLPVLTEGRRAGLPVEDHPARFPPPQRRPVTGRHGQ